MSIRFVENLDEEPTHGLFEVGTKILFTMINGAPTPYELIEPSGDHISFGIPATA